MRSRLVLILAVATGCQTYAVHRAALVPHATPLPIDGQPMSNPAELSLGASNVMDPASPSAGNPDAGDTVPTTQLRGSLSGRVEPDISIGAVYERGLANTSHAVTSSQPPIDNGDVAGYGVHLTWSIPLGAPGWRLGMSSELLLWTVPWVQYTTCVDGCGPSQGFTVMEKGTDTIATFALAVVPSYRTGRLTLFGGATARNHPTVTEKDLTDDPNSDADVRAGPFNLTLQAGASFDLGGGVRASMIVHQTVTRDPVSYGPSMAAMLAIPLGTNARPHAGD